MKQKNIISCSIIGSLAKNIYIPYKSDIDILVLISEWDIDELILLIQKYIPDLCFENDIYSGHIDSRPVSVAIRKYNIFVEYINDR